MFSKWITFRKILEFFRKSEKEIDDIRDPRTQCILGTYWGNIFTSTDFTLFSCNKNGGGSNRFHDILPEFIAPWDRSYRLFSIEIKGLWISWNLYPFFQCEIQAVVFQLSRHLLHFLKLRSPAISTVLLVQYQLISFLVYHSVLLWIEYSYDAVMDYAM